MICARRVALDGVELDQANSAIVIHSVETGDGKENFSAVSRAYGSGQRVTNHHRDTMDIIVRFAILIRKNNLAGRAAALEAARERGTPLISLGSLYMYAEVTAVLEQMGVIGAEKP